MTNTTETTKHPLAEFIARKPFVSVESAIWFLRTTGHKVTTEPGPDSTVSVYVNGQHAWDHEMSQEHITGALFRSVLSDHEDAPR